MRRILIIGSFIILLIGVPVGMYLIKQQQTVKSRASEQPTPTAPVNKKVLLLIYNPIIESSNNQKLVQQKGWNNPDTLTNQFIESVKEASRGFVNYIVSERIELDEYPVKIDGFRYTDSEYIDCAESNGARCHDPDGSDYRALADKVDACGKRNREEIDELWIWGGPWFGFWESNLAGEGAFWYNSSGTTATACQKLLPIMGFNYQRGEAEMFEDFAHRTEATMGRVYGSWNDDESHSWNKFALLDADKSGRGGCGNAHLAVNASSNIGYDRENRRTVSSRCEDFLNYPNLTDHFVDATCTSWGCTALGYFKWWFSHMPHVNGIGPDGKLNNWWVYITDPKKADLDRTPTATEGDFSNFYTSTSAGRATFSFDYSGRSNSYTIELSTDPDMHTDVYGDFASGRVGPITESNPGKWDKYRCGTQLYWRVYTTDRIYQSPIQFMKVCAVSTPSSTPSPSPLSTPSPTPSPSPTPTPTTISYPTPTLLLTPSPTPSPQTARGFVNPFFTNPFRQFLPSPAPATTSSVTRSVSAVTASIGTGNPQNINLQGISSPTFRLQAQTQPQPFTFFIQYSDGTRVPFVINMVYQPLGNTSPTTATSAAEILRTRQSTTPSAVSTPSLRLSPLPSPAQTASIEDIDFDLNKDGRVNTVDYALFLKQFLLKYKP